MTSLHKLLGWIRQRTSSNRHSTNDANTAKLSLGGTTKLPQTHLQDETGNGSSLHCSESLEHIYEEIGLPVKSHSCRFYDERDKLGRVTQRKVNLYTRRHCRDDDSGFSLEMGDGCNYCCPASRQRVFAPNDADSGLSTSSATSMDSIAQSSTDMWQERRHCSHHRASQCCSTRRHAKTQHDTDHHSFRADRQETHRGLIAANSPDIIKQSFAPLFDNHNISRNYDVCYSRTIDDTKCTSGIETQSCIDIDKNVDSECVSSIYATSVNDTAYLNDDQTRSVRLARFIDKAHSTNDSDGAGVYSDDSCFGEYNDGLYEGGDSMVQNLNDTADNLSGLISVNDDGSLSDCQVSLRCSSNELHRSQRAVANCYDLKRGSNEHRNATGSCCKLRQNSAARTSPDAYDGQLDKPTRLVGGGGLANRSTIKSSGKREEVERLAVVGVLQQLPPGGGVAPISTYRNSQRNMLLSDMTRRNHDKQLLVLL